MSHILQFCPLAGVPADLPMNQAGKIDRPALRRRFPSRLRSDERERAAQ